MIGELVLLLVVMVALLELRRVILGARQGVFGPREAVFWDKFLRVQISMCGGMAAALVLAWLMQLEG